MPDYQRPTEPLHDRFRHSRYAFGPHPYSGYSLDQSYQYLAMGAHLDGDHDAITDQRAALGDLDPAVWRTLIPHAESGYPYCEACGQAWLTMDPLDRFDVIAPDSDQPFTAAAAGYYDSAAGEAEYDDDGEPYGEPSGEWICTTCAVERNAEILALAPPINLNADTAAENTLPAPGAAEDGYQPGLLPGRHSGGDSEAHDFNVGDYLPQLLTSDMLDRAVAQLILDPVPHRQRRTISFEQEVGSGGAIIAEQVYALGLSSTPGVRGYHSSRHADDFCHVEQDSTVDAEVIWRMVDLSDRAHAHRMATGMFAVRHLIRTGHVALTARCGGHIHIDARGLSMSNLASLYHLFNHLEDVLYRIGSANWLGHRSETTGNSYAGGLPKNLTGVRDVYNNMQRGRYALNLSPYLSAMTACRCGAYGSGDWAACDCELGRPTIEFRLWNTTANLRKIRAYVALQTAMLQYVCDHTVTEDSHPPFDFADWRWQHGGTERDQDAAARAISLILNDLPLGANEREDILYCLRHSHLGASEVALEIADGDYRNLIGNPTLTSV